MAEVDRPSIGVLGRTVIDDHLALHPLDLEGRGQVRGYGAPVGGRPLGIHAQPQDPGPVSHEGPNQV